jgi:hypothetical protein
MVLVLAGMALVILRQRGGGPGAGTVPVD